MSNGQTKLASAIFVGVLATLPLSTLFDGAARAADDCLLEPNGQTPQGKHWYYRIEHGTGRHCWYVRGEDDPPRAAGTDPTTAAKTPSHNAEPIAPRAIADARAEWPARLAVAQNGAAAAPQVPPPAGDITGTAPPDTTSPASTATPWPDPPRAMPSLGAPPETTAAAADRQTDATTAPTPAPGPPPPALAAMPTDRNMGSLQKLLLVAFGALVLSGLTGSAVYRLAGARRRARMRRDRWPARKPQQIAGDVAMQPWAPPEIERITLHDLPRKSAELDALETDNLGAPVERIEDFLARLTRQLEAQMAAPRQDQQRAAN